VRNGARARRSISPSTRWAACLRCWSTSAAQVEALAQDMQQVTGGTVEMAYFAQAVLVRNLRLSQRRTGSS
jgi:hypothetical protein